jgi:hypothetical protein
MRADLQGSSLANREPNQKLSEHEARMVTATPQPSLREIR